MIVTLELPSEVGQIAKARAEAKGLSLEQYLPDIVAQAVQEDGWREEGAARLTMLGAEPVLRRLWDTPEEDEAWKDL